MTASEKSGMERFLEEQKRVDELLKGGPITMSLFQKIAMECPFVAAVTYHAPKSDIQTIMPPY